MTERETQAEDRTPGRSLDDLKVLIVGKAFSAADKSWISQFTDRGYDVRFLVTSDRIPAEDFPFTTFVTTVSMRSIRSQFPLCRNIDLAPRIRDAFIGFLRPGKRNQTRSAWQFLAWVAKAFTARVFNLGQKIQMELAGGFLTWVVRTWKPDVIVCTPSAAEFYFSVGQAEPRVEGIGRWIGLLSSQPSLFLGSKTLDQIEAPHDMNEVVTLIEEQERAVLRVINQTKDFDEEPYPGKPRILFVGEVLSSHASSWMSLLDGQQYNIRFFALPVGEPSESFPWPTYVTAAPVEPGNPLRKSLPRSSFVNPANPHVPTPESDWKAELAKKYLAHVIMSWKPDIIHTLGLTPAAEYYFDARKVAPDVSRIGRWILHLRGGSDLFFRHADPQRQYFGKIISEARTVISDNEFNYAYMERMGLATSNRASLSPVPGTGGIDVETLSSRWQGPPSTRRMILWPKAYESQWSKAVSILEALKIAWPRIQPCHVVILMVGDEVGDWLRLLPDDIRKSLTLLNHIDRQEVFDHMTKARVMLAPSLVDGVPNSMWEAMASGAVPLLSPLPTIEAVVRADENVLFARNLYPDEIADQIIRAMTDDTLVDRIAHNNLPLVRSLADRAKIQPRVLRFYQDILEEKP